MNVFLRTIGAFWQHRPEQIERTMADVSVIILSHNYGPMLGRAIESVLQQSVQPREILVIDDASTDTTRSVAESFAEQGVSYRYVEHRSLPKTRNTGARSTSQPFLLFVDADDVLPPSYIERCLECMKDTSVGFAYGDIQQFGERTVTKINGAFDAALLQHANYITSNALIRRQMFDLIGGYRDIPDLMEDWDFYRRGVAMGYKGAKARTFVHYHIHAQSILQQRTHQPQFSQEAGLLHQPFTIFTPFSGRGSVFEQYLAGLLSTDIDPSLIQLWWYNTSSDPSFDRLLRARSGQLPFGSVRYTHAPLPSLWGYNEYSLFEQREEEKLDAVYHYQLAVVRAYNTLLQECTTEYVLTLEDDHVLKSNTIRELFQTFDDDIAAVIAPYRDRGNQRYEVWMEGPQGSTIHFMEKGTGVQDVSGCGFGCTLFRSYALKNLMPLYTGALSLPMQGYDLISYLRLRPYGRIVCNWDLEVAHLQST